MMDFNRYEIYRAAFATDDVKICNECQIIVDDPNYDYPRILILHQINTF